MVGRPVRERSVDCIDQILEQALERTGYEEVSLVSLSTCDYSGVGELLARVVERAAPSDTAVSLPFATPGRLLRGTRGYGGGRAPERTHLRAGGGDTTPSGRYQQMDYG